MDLQLKGSPGGEEGEDAACDEGVTRPAVPHYDLDNLGELLFALWRRGPCFLGYGVWEHH